EQHVADPTSGAGQRSVEVQPHDVEHDAPREAVAVAVQTRRGQTEHDVVRLHIRAIHDALALDDADGESGQIVLAARVQIRQLRGLAADQRASRAPAALGDAAHERFYAVGVQARHPDVIQEVKRLCAVDQQIVDSHGDEVDPDRVMPIGEEGDL